MNSVPRDTEEADAMEVDAEIVDPHTESKSQAGTQPAAPSEAAQVSDSTQRPAPSDTPEAPVRSTREAEAVDVANTEVEGTEESPKVLFEENGEDAGQAGDGGAEGVEGEQPGSVTVTAKEDEEGGGAGVEKGHGGEGGVGVARREQIELQRQLKVKLSQAASAVDHLQYLVQGLLVAQARQASRRASGQEETLGVGEKKALSDAHNKRVGDIIAKQCLSVLKHLQNHKWAWPFNQPVDTQQFSDYLKVVARPMDLGTIRRGAETGHYKEPEHFAADMRLVFANAKTYNPPGSDVHVMASTLKARFEEKWQQSVVPKIADEMNTSRTEEAAALQRMREALRAREAEGFERSAQQLLKRIEALEAIMFEYKSAAASLCRGLGKTERAEVQRLLESLDQDALEGALRIVVGQHPGLLREGNTVELDVDLDELDALTLRLVQQYAQHAKSGDRKGSRGWPGVLVASGIKRLAPPRSVRHARRARKLEETAVTGTEPPTPVDANVSESAPLSEQHAAARRAAEQSSTAICAMETTEEAVDTTVSAGDGAADTLAVDVDAQAATEVAPPAVN